MPTALQPTGLMCDLLANPESTIIRNPHPKFSWIINDTESNAHQEAYQILVASNLETLAQNKGNMWDSGEPDPGGVWQSNPQSLHIPYEGAPLSSNTAYHWKVRTWNGNISPWSEPQTFHTGDLTEDYTTATYPLDTTEVAPVHLVHLTPNHAFIDFGRAAFGTIHLTLDSPTDAEIEIYLGEVPDGPHAINRNPGGARRYQMIPLQIQKGKHSYQIVIPTDPRNTKDFAILMPDDLFQVYPFRYYDVGTTISLEAWDDRFKPNQDWNHAWGAVPAGLIPFGLMGIQPLEPGFGKLRIAPQPGALAWADITTPTIRGPISVRFNNTLGKSFHLEVDLPGNTTAQLVVPKMNNDDPTVTVNGQRVFGVVEGETVMIDGIGSGRHTVERHA